MGYQGAPGWYTVGQLALELADLLRANPDARGWAVQVEIGHCWYALDKVAQLNSARPDMAANGMLALIGKERDGTK
jgi:hypothetical protein